MSIASMPPPRPGAKSNPTIAAPAPLFLAPFTISHENQGSEIESILAGDRGAGDALTSPFRKLDRSKMVKVASWCSIDAVSPRSPESEGLPSARGGVSKHSRLELCDLEEAYTRQQKYEIYTEQHEMVEPPRRSCNPLKNLLAADERVVLPPLKRAPYGAELRLDNLSPVMFR
eukprot:TRINITY_DN5004_c0_g2_i1.p2 TRINITY_DN5004_c0_g2~~TRINITY_DN5004_c0_g2_i1.p2  ORF type:complete len:173 (+),score=48.90 TRINITY_DN5004_c0_g2_i1:170-688(+)